MQDAQKLFNDFQVSTIMTSMKNIRKSTGYSIEKCVDICFAQMYKEYDSRIITSDRIVNAFVNYQTKDTDEDAFKFGFLFYLTLFNEYYKQNAAISAM